MRPQWIDGVITTVKPARGYVIVDSSEGPALADRKVLPRRIETYANGHEIRVMVKQATVFPGVSLRVIAVDTADEDNLRFGEYHPLWPGRRARVKTFAEFQADGDAIRLADERRATRCLTTVGAQSHENESEDD